MLGQVYMLSILIIHMKHFPWSPNNDSSFFTSLNFDALKLKFGNRRYRQYIQCFLERLNKGILSTYIYIIYSFIYLLSVAKDMQLNGEETQMMVGPIFTVRPSVLYTKG